VLAAGGFAAGVATDAVAVREASSVLVVVATIATIRRSDARWDLLAPSLGVVGLVAAGFAAADGAHDTALGLARILVGTVFLGAVSDAMLLGHWYLNAPGMRVDALRRMIDLALAAWGLELAWSGASLAVGLAACGGSSSSSTSSSAAPASSAAASSSAGASSAAPSPATEPSAGFCSWVPQLGRMCHRPKISDESTSAHTSP